MLLYNQILVCKFNHVILFVGSKSLSTFIKIVLVIQTIIVQLYGPYMVILFIIMCMYFNLSSMSYPLKSLLINSLDKMGRTAPRKPIINQGRGEIFPKNKFCLFYVMLNWRLCSSHLKFQYLKD